MINSAKATGAKIERAAYSDAMTRTAAQRANIGDDRWPVVIRTLFVVAYEQ
jgi:hypothetical protein